MALYALSLEGIVKEIKSLDIYPDASSPKISSTPSPKLKTLSHPRCLPFYQMLCFVFCLFVCLGGFLAMLCSLNDLSSLTRDQTHALGSESVES